MSKASDSLNAAFEIDIDSSTILQEGLPDENYVASQVIVSPPATLPTTSESPVDTEDTEDAKQDFEFARNNLRDLANKAHDLLEQAIQFAENDESARGYEVAGGILKQVSEINKDILALRKTRKEIQNITGSSNHNNHEIPVQQGAINIDKAVFVGSPSEVLKKIKTK